MKRLRNETPGAVGWRRWRSRTSGILVSALALGALAVGGRASAQDLEEVTVFRLAENRRDVLLMEGTINENSPAQLNAVLNSNSQIRTIVLLQCLGSSDDEANFPMARGVRDRGLDTHLTSRSEIYSGCVDFFVAGNRRTMEAGAKIGVHSWYDDDDRKQAIEYPRGSPEHELNRKYIEDMLGSDAFYWFTIQVAPAEGMHYMTRQEIASFGMLTD